MSDVKNIPRLRFPDFTESWKRRKLKDFSSFFSGGTPTSTIKKFYNGNIPFIKSGEINSEKTNQFLSEEGLNNSSAKRVNNGDLLYALYGATSGEVGISKMDGAINQAVLCIRGDFNNNLLANYLKKEKNKIVSTYLQGGQGNLSAEIIKNLKLSLPSLPEQQKIADFLTAVDKRIEFLEKKKTLLETYKKGVMKKIFNQEIRFKDDNGNDFPDWEEKRLDEISKFRRGSFPQPYGLPEWYDEIDGKPFVQVYDVNDNFKLKPETKQKISSLAQPKSVFVPKESIVITIQGSIGRVAITQYDSYVDRTLLIFTSINKDLNKYFFVYQLYRLFEIEKRKAPGGTIKTITKEKLSSFTILLPDKTEQLKISNFFFLIDKQLELFDSLIDKSKTWKKGLLQKMFV